MPLSDDWVENVSNSWPDYLLEDIQARIDIVDVISDYVVLTRKGKNYLGLCPFHSEKTPSFTVTPDKQMFYCFGCQTGGNAFTFLQKKENISFVEAVRVLATKAGVHLPEKELSPAEKALHKERELAEQINKAAQEFFHSTLLTSPKAQAARDYLSNRGIARDAIDAFQLGFALDGWSNLGDFLLARGYTVEQLDKVGLVTPKDNVQCYDRFRNRIIFPIFNVHGHVIGFGGRVLDDSLPKYLNSPETAYFSKGHNLYGINHAHKAMRDKGEALVVEGYMDVIACHSNGFPNAVASLGTALTREQGKLMMRYTSNVLLAYDADAAGINATHRGAELLRDLGCKVKVLSVSGGKDPDEFLRHHKPEDFASLVESAPSWVQFKLASLVKTTPLSGIDAKVKIVSEMANDILKTESLVEREGYIRLIANTLGVTEHVISAEIMRISAKNRKKGYFSDNSHSDSHTNMEHYQTEFANIGKENTLDVLRVKPGSSVNKIYRAENLLLRLMLLDPKVIVLVAEELQWESFTDTMHDRVLCLIKEAWQKGNWNPLNWAAAVNDEALGSYLAQISMEETGIGDVLKGAADCIQVIKGQQIKEKIKSLQEEARVLQNSGDMEKALEILLEINRLVKQPASGKNRSIKPSGKG